MVATNLKAETITLMDERSSMESQMNAIIDDLCQPGGPGISGNLIDSEGFPRSDIDISAVRFQRQRLSELQNEYKDITDKIDKNLQVLHSVKLAQNASLLPQNSESLIDMDPSFKIPFAVVDEISEASPAVEDGLQLGDQIMKFGSVEVGDEVLPRLALEAQANQGNPVPVIIMRQGSLIKLTLTPRQWQGRGLLGCHFRIL